MIGALVFAVFVGAVIGIAEGIVALCRAARRRSDTHAAEANTLRSG